MRKIISLGLFALMLSIFSSQVFAGDVGACDELTDPDSDPDIYAPGLYGLCVAWHNANENGRAAIEKNYSKRGGGTIPGSGFSCPCWKEVSFENVCSLRIPTRALIFGFFNTIEYKDNGLDEFFATHGRGCIYDGQFTEVPQVVDDLSGDIDPITGGALSGEVLDCRAEIAVIALMYIDGACDEN